MRDIILETLGPPDVLVSNAGLFEPGSIEETTAEGFRRQVDVNLISAFLVTKAFLPAMRAAGCGDLFFMGSVASIRAYPSGTDWMDIVSHNSLSVGGHPFVLCQLRLEFFCLQSLTVI